MMPNIQTPNGDIDYDVHNSIILEQIMEKLAQIILDKGEVRTLEILDDVHTDSFYRS